MPIDWATRNFNIFQILQLKSIILQNFRNFKRANPKGFEFTMFSLIFPLSIPFEYQVSKLENFLLHLLVKNFFDFVFMTLCFVKKKSLSFVVLPQGYASSRSWHLVPLLGIKKTFPHVKITEQGKQLQFHKPVEMVWCQLTFWWLLCLPIGKTST